MNIQQANILRKTPETLYQCDAFYRCPKDYRTKKWNSDGCLVEVDKTYPIDPNVSHNGKDRANYVSDVYVDIVRAMMYPKIVEGFASDLYDKYVIYYPDTVIDYVICLDAVSAPLAWQLAICFDGAFIMDENIRGRSDVSLSDKVVFVAAEYTNGTLSKNYRGNMYGKPTLTIVTTGSIGRDTVRLAEAYQRLYRKDDPLVKKFLNQPGRLAWHWDRNRLWTDKEVKCGITDGVREYPLHR